MQAFYESPQHYMNYCGVLLEEDIISNWNLRKNAAEERTNAQ